MLSKTSLEITWNKPYVKIKNFSDSSALFYPYIKDKVTIYLRNCITHYDPKDKVIFLNIELVLIYPEQVNRILLHEYAHYLLDIWKFPLNIIGIKAEYLCEYFVANVFNLTPKKCHKHAMTYVHIARKAYIPTKYSYSTIQRAKLYLVKEAEKLKSIK